MIKQRLAMAALILLSTVPAMAGEESAPADSSAVQSQSGQTAQAIPQVAPGDQIAITCDPLASREAGSDVRVVLTVSAAPGEPDLGYKKVLATDAQLLKDAVRVRIPRAPDLDDHTIGLDVYVVDNKGSQRCDAGQIKVS